MTTLKEIRREPRRFAMLLAAVTVAAIVSLAGGRAQQGHATTGGSAYEVPLVGNMGDPGVTAVDTNPSPTVIETTIQAKYQTVDIGNSITAHALTFNGTIPGPTFKLHVGDTVIVRLVNNLLEPTGMHWHGIELSNFSDGTPFTQNQTCGTPTVSCTFLYKFTATRPGIFWYHPHHHSSTNQVFKGLYGMIVVTDPNEADLLPSGTHPTLPPLSATLPIVLSDITVCKASYAMNEPSYPAGMPWVGNPGGGAVPAMPVQDVPRAGTRCKDSPLDLDGNPHAQWGVGDIPNIQTIALSGRENEGNIVLTNGKNVGARNGSPSSPGSFPGTHEDYPVQSGQGLRLQLLNASAIRYMRLRLTTEAGTQVDLVRVGGEGGLLDHAVVEGGTPGGFDTQYTHGEILLPPGTRADVVAAIPSVGVPAGSTLTLWTEDYFRTGMGFSNIPTVPVMHLHVTGAAGGTPYTIADGTPLRSATGNLVPVLSGSASVLNTNGFVPAKTAVTPPAGPFVTLNNIQLGQAGQGQIDGIFGTHDVSGDYASALHLWSSRFARVGNTLSLSVENTTSAHHPFHLHGFSMQPTSLTKPSSPTFTWGYHEFRDNIDIPPGYTLHFRIELTNRPLADGVTLGGALGRWVFHCHIFFHATNGMLSELVVLPAGSGPTDGNEKPTVNTAGTWEFAAAGDLAERHGTYHDPDGDPVTLDWQPHIGNLVQDASGPGTWQWTYDTTGQPDSTQYIYVTATDSHNNKDQTFFRLKIGGIDDGSDNGDPHISTVNGKNYDFQGVGEFTLLRDEDGLELQARQTPVPTATQIFNTYTGLTSCVSVNTAVAAQLGAHHVSYQTGPTAANVLQLFLDGKQLKEFRTGLDLGHGYRVDQYALASGARAVELDYPDKTVITVTPWFWSANNIWLLQVDVKHTPADEGVMGNTTSGWLPALPSGASLGPRPVALHDRYIDLHKTFADAWRVTPSDSLFTYGPGQSTATYSLPSYPPESGPCVVPKGFGQPFHPTGFQISLEEAQRLCTDIIVTDLHDDCVGDVDAMDDPNVVKNYQQQQNLRLEGTTVRMIGNSDVSAAGAPVTFTATVAPMTTGRPVPTGTVKFTVDGVATGPPVALNSRGMGTFTISTLGVGMHEMAARYTPSAGSAVLPSTAPNLAHEVLKGGKTTPITVANLLGPSGLNGWFTGPVTVTLSLYTAQGPPPPVPGTTKYRIDGGPWLVYGKPFTIDKNGRHKVDFFTTSADGSVESPKSISVELDLDQPDVTVSTPPAGDLTNGALPTYDLKKNVRAKFACKDATSGIATCDGSVRNGDFLDTSKVGLHTFTVQASDQAGNTAMVTRQYLVQYRFGGFTAPITPSGKGLNRVKAGDLIKVGFSLGGDFGLNIFAPDFPLSTGFEICPDEVAHDVPSAGVGSKPGLSYTGHYVLGWQTQAAWGGTCRRLVLKLNDGTSNTYTADFQFMRPTS